MTDAVDKRGRGFGFPTEGADDNLDVGPVDV